jgi:hypothetical protein
MSWNRHSSRRRTPLTALSAVALVALVLGAMPAERDSTATTAITPPADPAARAIYEEALAHAGPKIMISTSDLRLWYVGTRDTLLQAPVAIGMQKSFSHMGKSWYFATPTGERRILGKAKDPVWTAPDWHYYERAASLDYELVHMERGKMYKLADGTFLEVREDDVGRINQFGNFWPFTPGYEIVFDQTVYMPPLDTRQRRIPDALGPYKLDMGEGYLIHGTHRYNGGSVGLRVSHGCVRMNNSDVERLYHMVDVGTPVFIF